MKTRGPGQHVEVPVASKHAAPAAPPPHAPHDARAPEPRPGTARMLHPKDPHILERVSLDATTMNDLVKRFNQMPARLQENAEESRRTTAQILEKTTERNSWGTMSWIFNNAEYHKERNRLEVELGALTATAARLPGERTSLEEEQRDLRNQINAEEVRLRTELDGVNDVMRQVDRADALHAEQESARAHLREGKSPPGDRQLLAVDSGGPLAPQARQDLMAEMRRLAAGRMRLALPENATDRQILNAVRVVRSRIYPESGRHLDGEMTPQQKDKLWKDFQNLVDAYNRASSAAVVQALPGRVTQLAIEFEPPPESVPRSPGAPDIAVRKSPPKVPPRPDAGLVAKHFQAKKEEAARLAEQGQVRAALERAQAAMGKWSSAGSFDVNGVRVNAYTCDAAFVKAWADAVAQKPTRRVFRGAGSDVRNQLREKAVDAFRQNVAQYEARLSAWRTAAPEARAQIELELVDIRANLTRLGSPQVLGHAEMRKTLKAQALDPAKLLDGLDRSTPADLRTSREITRARLALANGVRPTLTSQGINGAQFMRAEADGAPTLVFKAKPLANDTDANRQSISRQEELRNSFIAAQLGAGLGLPVPNATMASMDGRLGLVQDCVPRAMPFNNIRAEDLRIVDHRGSSDPPNTIVRHDLERMVSLKLIIGDTDGHPGNGMRTSTGQVFAIDHDLSLPGAADIYMHRNMFANCLPPLERPMTDETRKLLSGIDVDQQMTALDQAQTRYAAQDPALLPLSPDKRNLHRMRLELAKIAAEEGLSLNQWNAIMTAPHIEQAIGANTEWTRVSDSNLMLIYKEAVRDGEIDWARMREQLRIAARKAKAVPGETEWQKYERAQRLLNKGAEAAARKRAAARRREPPAAETAEPANEESVSTSVESGTSVGTSASTSVSTSTPDKSRDFD